MPEPGSKAVVETISDEICKSFAPSRHQFSPLFYSSIATPDRQTFRIPSEYRNRVQKSCLKPLWMTFRRRWSEISSLRGISISVIFLQCGIAVPEQRSTQTRSGSRTGKQLRITFGGQFTRSVFPVFFSAVVLQWQSFGIRKSGLEAVLDAFLVTLGFTY